MVRNTCVCARMHKGMCVHVSVCQSFWPSVYLPACHHQSNRKQQGLQVRPEEWQTEGAADSQESKMVLVELTQQNFLEWNPKPQLHLGENMKLSPLQWHQLLPWVPCQGDCLQVLMSPAHVFVWAKQWYKLRWLSGYQGQTWCSPVPHNHCVLRKFQTT